MIRRLQCLTGRKNEDRIAWQWLLKVWISKKSRATKLNLMANNQVISVVRHSRKETPTLFKGFHELLGRTQNCDFNVRPFQQNSVRLLF